jgi:hypothetical protein
VSTHFNEDRAMFAATTPATLGRKTCAVLAVGSAGLHAVMVGHAANVVAAGLLAVMIVACLYCARDLWLDGTMRAWVVLALMNLAMIALHLPVPSHHHSAVGPTLQSSVMAAATLLALVEVLAAAAVLYVRTRGRTVGVSGSQDR